MATVPVVSAALNGAVLTPTGATAGPDDVEPGDNVALLALNNDASSITVTVTVPGNTRFGEPQPDVVSVNIPAGDLAVIGPLPRTLADPADGLVDVTSSSTSVDLFAIRV